MVDFVRGIVFDRNKRLFIALASIIAITTIALVLFNQGIIADYLVAASIIYLLIMAIMFNLDHPDSIKILNISSAIIFLGFLVYIVSKIIYVLG